MSDEPRSIQDRLADPFDPADIKWKPQSVKGNKALAIAYVGVRVIEDRLDAVVGVEGWSDSYEVLSDGCAVCKLSLKIGDAWVTKMDVGNPSEQPDAGDRLKASFSDALKRTAIKFGIGRYIYRLPQSWVDFDPAKKQIVRPPQLPDWAIPGKGSGSGQPRPAPPSQPAQQSRPAATPPTSPLPAPSKYDQAVSDLKAAWAKGNLQPAWNDLFKRQAEFTPDQFKHLEDTKNLLKAQQPVR